jgi:hypothetical protein
MAVNLETITIDRAHEIIEMNRRGEKPESLTEGGKATPEKAAIDLAGGDINRFDKTKKKKKKNKSQQAKKGEQPKKGEQAKKDEQPKQ